MTVPAIFQYRIDLIVVFQHLIETIPISTNGILVHYMKSIMYMYTVESLMYNQSFSPAATIVQHM